MKIQEHTSREKVIWNEATKKFIGNVLEKATIEAADLIEKQLHEETDLISWLIKCRDVYTKMDHGSVLSRLSGIVDKESIKPKFAPDKEIKRESTSQMFKYLDVRIGQWDANNKKVVRSRIENWAQLAENNVFIMGEDNHSQLKDRYLIDSTGGGTVIFVKDRDPELNINAGDSDEVKDSKRAAFVKAKDKAKKVLSYLVKSELSRDYDSIEVPEDWKEEKKKEAEIAEKMESVQDLTDEERRKIEEKVVAFSLRHNYKGGIDSTKAPFIKDKVEVTMKMLMETENLTYYGTSEDDEKLLAAGVILYPFAMKASEAYSNSWDTTAHSDCGSYDSNSHDKCYFIDAPPVRYCHYSTREPMVFADRKMNSKIVESLPTPQLLRVSKSNLKYLKKNPNMVHIDGFFRQRKPDGTYTMDQHVIDYFTAKAVEGIRHYNWMFCFQEINPDLYDKFHRIWKLYQKIDSVPSNYCMSQFPEVMEHIQKLLDFHKFCNDNDGNEQAISAESRRLFVVDVKSAEGYVQEILDDFKELMEFAEPVHPLMSKVIPFNNASTEADLKNAGELYSYTQEQIEQIKVYFDAQDRLNWVY